MFVVVFEQYVLIEIGLVEIVLYYVVVGYVDFVVVQEDFGIWFGYVDWEWIGGCGVQFGIDFYLGGGIGCFGGVVGVDDVCLWELCLQFFGYVWGQ